MFEVNAAEKIETVVKARVSGAFGEFENLEHGRCKVIVEGVAYLVTTDARGWLVVRVGSNFIAADADLYLAAKMAIHAG